LWVLGGGERKEKHEKKKLRLRKGKRILNKVVALGKSTTRKTEGRKPKEKKKGKSKGDLKKTLGKVTTWKNPLLRSGSKEKRTTTQKRWKKKKPTSRGKTMEVTSISPDFCFRRKGEDRGKGTLTVEGGAKLKKKYSQRGYA